MPYSVIGSTSDFGSENLGSSPDRAAKSAYQLKRYHAKRAIWIQELGGVCINCGTTEQLEFHHINPKDKSFNVAERYDCRAVIDELKKCQLLCKNCHDNIHQPDHGTTSRYKHRRCRCQPCKDANNRATKLWKRGLSATKARLAQLAEATDLKSVQYQFESDSGHHQL